MSSVQQRKLKYARPCDKCSLRKIKCDRMMPCSTCIKQNLMCSNEREIKKRGPKSIKLKTSEDISHMYNTFTNKDSIKYEELSTDEYFQPRVTMREISPFLKIYQNWYYDIWPVISIDQLTTSILSNKDEGKLDLNSDNIQSYILCCALAGTIKDIIHLVSFYDKLIIPSKIEEVDFIGECLRARNFCDYKSHPTLDTILASFFLFIYHTDANFNFLQAVLYLREAIAITEVLKLNSESRHKEYTLEEKFRLQRIYQLLLITERSTCLLTNLPIVLEVTTFDDCIDHEYYPKPNGFSEIVKVFSLPDASFFANKSNSTKRSAFFSKQLFLRIDKELANIYISDDIHKKQKLNIILTKNWMRLLIWNTCITTKHLGIFENDFPITLAIDFLSRSNDIPLYAFESNGRGVCSKLLEIGESISLVINEKNLNVAYNTLMSILNIISLLKANIVSKKIHQRIQKLLQNEAFVSVPMNLLFSHSPDEANPAENYLDINSNTGMINVIGTSIDVDIPSMENMGQYSPVSHFRSPFIDSASEKLPFEKVSESANIQVINDREEDIVLGSHQSNICGNPSPISQFYSESTLGQLCSNSPFSQSLFEFKIDSTSAVKFSGINDTADGRTVDNPSFTLHNFLVSEDK